MKIPSAVLDKLRRRPIEIFGVILGLALLVTEGVKKILYAEELLQKITNAGIIKPSGIGELPLRLWYANTIFFLIVFLAFVAALYIRAQFKREWNGPAQESTELAQVRDKLGRVEAEFRRMMAASLQIRHQLTSPHTNPELELRLVDFTYVVRSTFDVHVIRRYDVKAAISAVHFWDVFISVDDDACEVDFLDSLGFKVEDESGRGLVYLPFKNENRSKGVTLFFLPSIDIGEQTARRIKIQYQWPGLANRLKTRKHDSWTWTLGNQSSAAKEKVIPEVKIKFCYEDLGGELEADIIGEKTGEQQLKFIEKTQTTLKTLEYTIKNAPRAKYALELRLNDKF